MPELPEVENTVRYLRQKLKGCAISNVDINWPRLIAVPSLDLFREQVANSKILSILRRGKYIIIKLSKNDKQAISYLFAHMRMSGSFDVVSPKAIRSKHDHVVFRCSHNREIRFHDPRKFGRFFLVDDPKLVVGKLGPEPLEQSFKHTDFYKIIHARNTAIKTLLLDQYSIAGVGNIYADESLWRAGIHPLARTKNLTVERVKKLHNSIRLILIKAIGTGGTDNGDGVVEGGMYQPKVYGRSGLPCFRCKTALQKCIVSQRGTTYCKKCQLK